MPTGKICKMISKRGRHFIRRSSVVDGLYRSARREKEQMGENAAIVAYNDHRK
jgi:hypothetical protein